MSPSAAHTCTLARDAVLVKAENKSLTAVLAFKQVHLLWDSVLQCLKHVISQAVFIRLEMQLDRATVSSRGQTQMPQGQCKEQSMHVVVLPLPVLWSSPCGSGIFTPTVLASSNFHQGHSLVRH